MDYIARHGWDVYLIDVRGYGQSTRPPEMDQPPASNPPIVTTDVAVRDVGSAINFILQRRGLSKLSLMGWSWGTVIMGAYTADHNDKVDRLVLYAPTWLRISPPPQTAPPPLGAYVAAPMATARQRLIGYSFSRRCNFSWIGNAGTELLRLRSTECRDFRYGSKAEVGRCLALCPLYPQKRTSGSRTATSALGYKRTHASQQRRVALHGYSITSSASASSAAAHLSQACSRFSHC
jgi:pimeloyl-ACP methyl ester carboxylesterase